MITAASLYNRHRILATGKETSRLTIHRDQVGLGKCAQCTLLLQGTKKRKCVATHQKQIQRGGESSAQQSVLNSAESTWSLTTVDITARTRCALVSIGRPKLPHSVAAYFRDTHHELHLH